MRSWILLTAAALLLTPADAFADRRPALGRKFVFVTSTTHDGNLGGLKGADAICRSLAKAAGLGTRFMAWISDDSSGGPPLRFRNLSANPYLLTDGVIIAANWADLVDGTLRQGVVFDENGAFVSGEVWTGTNPLGDVGIVGCSDWSVVTR
jgi:hypothetical protein